MYYSNHDEITKLIERIPVYASERTRFTHGGHDFDNCAMLDHDRRP